MPVSLFLPKECVINIPTVELAAKAVGCGNTSGQRGGNQGMDRPFEEGATDNPSSRQGRVHGRGQDDHVALEDEIARAMRQGRIRSVDFP